MPKTSTSEKIIALLDKLSVEDAIIEYHTIKSYMTARLIQKTEELEEEQSKLNQIKEKL